MKQCNVDPPKKKSSKTILQKPPTDVDEQMALVVKPHIESLWGSFFKSWGQYTPRPTPKMTKNQKKNSYLFADYILYAWILIWDPKKEEEGMELEYL